MYHLSLGLEWSTDGKYEDPFESSRRKVVRFPHHYRWSSYLYYSGKHLIHQDFIKVHPILDLFQESDPL